MSNDVKRNRSRIRRVLQQVVEPSLIIDVVHKHDNDSNAHGDRVMRVDGAWISDTRVTKGVTSIHLPK